MELEIKKDLASNWFKMLQDAICHNISDLEKNKIEFKSSNWKRNHKKDEGGGEFRILENGKVFDKVGVNFSKVYGKFPKKFQKNILGAKKDPRFWASGISVVAHMWSPHVPAVHMNTRHITTTKSWFGGGSDLTPMVRNDDDKEIFHSAFEATCNKYDPTYYPRFKKWCDEYFYLAHRNEPRGIGGIFYDQLDDNFDSDFLFTKDIGSTFNTVFPKIVQRHMDDTWTEKQREMQLIKRGRYVEFNLLHDRGTLFGLKTGGNVEAILMSLPPQVAWPAPSL